MGFFRELQYVWKFVALFFPPKPTFNEDQIPDLSGRVCIVTGGYTGVGKEITRALLQHNAKVYIAVRSKETAEAVIQELNEITGKQAIFLQLDLADLPSVRLAANEFMSREPELHILFNNAGVLVNPALVNSTGCDFTFSINVLGHWYFTDLLMPALLRGKQSAPDLHARIVTVSSSTAYLSTIRWDMLRDGPEHQKTDAFVLYAQSKFGNVALAIETARRYQDQGIVSIVVDPGFVKSGIQRHVNAYNAFIDKYLNYPTSLGALTPLYAGTMPEALQYNGQFLVPRVTLARMREEAYDPEVGKKLWSWLEDQIKMAN